MTKKSFYTTILILLKVEAYSPDDKHIHKNMHVIGSIKELDIIEESPFIIGEISILHLSDNCLINSFLENCKSVTKVYYPLQIMVKDKILIEDVNLKKFSYSYTAESYIVIENIKFIASKIHYLNDSKQIPLKL